jgi:predicted transcriptional regulator
VNKVETKRGRGRPKKEHSKQRFLNVRLDEDDHETLDFIMEFTDMTRSQIVREAIRFYRKSKRIDY